MAIVVTSGATNAVAYDDTTGADAYFLARGIAAWTGSTTSKEEALVRGADYLDNEYHALWLGRRTNETQSMDWPRSWVTDEDGFAIETDEIPTRLKEANYEAALLSLTGESLEPTLDARIKRKSSQAGVSTETEYFQGASQRKTFTTVHNRVKPLLRSDGNSFPLLRV